MSPKISRIHPITLIALIALIISIVFEGTMKYIAISVFLIIVIAVILWIYEEISSE